MATEGKKHSKDRHKTGRGPEAGTFGVLVIGSKENRVSQEACGR